MLFAAPLSMLAQQRQEVILSDNWSFSHDKQSWQTEKSGRSGALPWIGEGHYKRTISIPKDCPHAELLFDGAMAEPHVSINGKEVAFWAYGYNTFRVDITPYVKAGDNLLEVDLQNLEESSRWYPGAGIYRPVKLILTGENWIDPWKTFIRTRSLRFGDAKIDITVGTGSSPDADVSFEVEICDKEGRVVAKGNSDKVGIMGKADMSITVEDWKMQNYGRPRHLIYILRA